tara:strand:+ start:144 stop:926 length:783 start_codon:yes stop_codon:yes gene_type:complete
MFSLLLLPFFITIILVLIHVYFGSFVLKRGILFIDIALAQWAALGYLVGVAFAIESAILLFLIGFIFTVIASIIFISLKPIFNEINQQEAIIGILYITATALAIGIISSTGMEGHHLNEMLSGHLLFIQPKEVIFAYILYTIIGLILIKCHTKFIQQTILKWDLLFYILFGLVVTSSVKIAGVLLVFSYLVLPIISATLLYNQFKTRLISAWIIGAVGSIIGLASSLFLDIAPTYCIIYALVLIWIGLTLFSTFKHKKTR